MSVNMYLEGNYAPVDRRGHGVRSAGDRRAARRAERPLPAQRAEPVSTSPIRPRTTGSSATAWCTACACATAGPSGTATVTSASPRSASTAASPTSRAATGTTVAGGPNTNVGGFAGTTWAMVEAGGCPVELDLRARDRRPQRLLRHAARGVHRPPEGRSRHRRDARDGLRPAAVARPRAVRRRRAPTARCAARSTSRCRR